MDWNLVFFLNSILLGIGLAMDAFSVSIANALNDPQMKRRRMCVIALCYAVFQFIMPMIGWFCVHSIVEYFVIAQKFIPWIALILLGYIGGKMIYDSVRQRSCEVAAEPVRLGLGTLLIQGLATSIDALSVGFTTASYGGLMAFVSSLIIAVETFFICMCGLAIGKKAGTLLCSHASLAGGLILIGIGLEIFIKGIFF